MASIEFRLKFYLAVFLVVIICGTLSFMWIENLALADALYFMIVTMATVGYGDLHPVTPAGRFLAIIFIVLGVGTFLGVVANATELMLNRREKQNLTNKINVLVGIFYSEVGNALLRRFTRYDPNIESIREQLNARANWDVANFNKVLDNLKAYEYDIDPGRINFDGLSKFLKKRRNIMIRLLEHPALFEHEGFTELLRAVFHLTEELDYRGDFNSLPESDRKHLAVDAKRVYGQLVFQWIYYMRHLKTHYPYLFSLEARISPFNIKARPIVT